jgi:hypothetical protein
MNINDLDVEYIHWNGDFMLSEVFGIDYDVLEEDQVVSNNQVKLVGQELEYYMEILEDGTIYSMQLEMGPEDV